MKVSNCNASEPTCNDWASISSPSTPSTLCSQESEIDFVSFLFWFFTSISVYARPFCSLSYLSIFFLFPQNLHTVLNNSAQGRSILKSYRENNYLLKSERNKLCSLICERWINSGRRITAADYKKAAESIKSVFPKEELVCSGYISLYFFYKYYTICFTVKFLFLYYFCRNHIWEMIKGEEN